MPNRISSPRPPQAANALTGTLCLLAGVALAILVVAVRLEGLWNLPTSLIRRNPVLMLGFAIALALIGARLLWDVRQIATHWTPTRPGRRFDSLVIYTKNDCPLCDEAAGVLETYQSYLPPLERIDVMTDAERNSKYAGCVPVIEIDGRRRFTGQVNEVLLRRLIEGTPPATD